MGKIKYFLFILLMFLTINVKAEDYCETKELARVKELAKKVEFSYDYKLVDEKAVFSITAVNLNDDLKVLIIKDYYNDDYKQFKNSETHKATLDGFESGERVTITINAFVPNFCSGKNVLKKIIRLPYYNYAYSEEKCRGNEDFKYCKILTDTYVSQGEFDRQFEIYLKNKEKGGKTDNNTQVNNTNTNLYLYIGGGILVVIIVVVMAKVIIKRRKKNSL